MDERTKKTCCFTGHRHIPKELSDPIGQLLEKTIVNLVEKGYLYFEAGGALGFDTLAEKAVLHLKNQYPQIKLILVLPCKTQTRGWSEDDTAIYKEMKRRADKIVYTSKEYTRGCMHKRNRCLVEKSSACISYLTKSNGGTAYTVEYAKKNGLPVINIADLL